MNDLPRQAAEVTLATSASKATYTGATASAAGWLMSNEFIAVGGFALAVLGFAVNLYFKIKEDRRQEALHLAQMRDIERKPTDSDVSEEIQRAIDNRLSARPGEFFGGYSGMPKPPTKPVPEPKPVDDEGSK